MSRKSWEEVPPIGAPIGDLEPWEHGAEPLDELTMIEIGDALEDPMASSEGHKRTLRVCRRLWDEAADRMRLPAQFRGVARKALVMIAAERRRQDEKWQREPGAWDSPAGTKALVLGEEYGEVCNAVLERKPDDELLAELIQVAAVAAAWAEVILAGNRAGGEPRG